MTGESTSALGAYLRARREQVNPVDVGLATGGRRRVGGLRREELALLAGVSADYYIRLEQGRHAHPSAQVLDGLARVLMLDEDASRHLHELAGVAAAKPRRRRPPARVGPGLRDLVLSWTTTPAFVTSAFGDVLVANELATALNPGCAVGSNVIRRLFLDESSLRDLYIDYDQVAVETVGVLRAALGADVGAPDAAALVGELSIKSDTFRRLWPRQDVKVKGDGPKRFNHPLVGDFELRYETFHVAGTDRQRMTVYHALPGTRGAEALQLLATLVLNGRPATETPRMGRPARIGGPDDISC